MAVTLAIFGVAFAAFCVWLGVRIVNRRERWAKWALAATVVVPMLYVASFGPACWLVSSRVYPLIGVARVAPRIYWPLGALHKNGPVAVASLLDWYAKLGCGTDERVLMPASPQ